MVAIAFRLEGTLDRIVGDAVIAELDHAGSVTPVPGGVGPMTIACLLSNTLSAAQKAGAARRAVA